MEVAMMKKPHIMLNQKRSKLMKARQNEPLLLSHPMIKKLKNHTGGPPRLEKQQWSMGAAQKQGKPVTARRVLAQLSGEKTVQLFTARLLFLTI